MTSHRRVAIIENDDAIRDLFQDILEGEGYNCLSKNSERGAVEMVEQETPDLIILDIVLSGTASGWWLLDQLARNPTTAGIPIIVCTVDAHALSSHELDLRERGIYSLTKPFEVEYLLRLVNEAIASHGAPSAAAAI